MIVQMLGQFSMINEQGNILNEENLHSNMAYKLLAYLLIHRTQVSTKEEIMEVLWSDGESDNPLGALKTLTCRLRNLLNKYLGKNKYIITRNGGYQWNLEIPVEIDVEKFSDLYAKIREYELSDKIKLEKLEQAFVLYQGEFLSSIEDLHWIVVLRSYYHTLMIKTIVRLAEFYIACERYEDLEQMCVRALSFDYSDEDIHYYLILSQIYLKKIKSALDAYNNAVHIIREELGIAEPMRLKLLEGQILKLTIGPQNGNLDSMISELNESLRKGAFFCGYPVFKEIYHLETRRVERMKLAGIQMKRNNIFLMLFCLESNVEDYHLEQQRLNQMMKKLKLVIEQSLRSGDVFTQYSDRQYLVMLDGCVDENCKKISDRIIGKVEEIRKDIKIKTEWKELIV